MSDLSPTSRALRTLDLIQATPGITADRLALELGVTERAARRYVAILREAGIRIDATTGPYGGDPPRPVGGVPHRRGLSSPAADVQRRRGDRPRHGRARRSPRGHRPERRRQHR